eukprot:3672750-Rhodomonas_salina.3
MRGLTCKCCGFRAAGLKNEDGSEIDDFQVSDASSSRLLCILPCVSSDLPSLSRFIRPIVPFAFHPRLADVGASVWSPRTWRRRRSGRWESWSRTSTTRTSGCWSGFRWQCAPSTPCPARTTPATPTATTSSCAARSPVPSPQSPVLSALTRRWMAVARPTRVRACRFSDARLVGEVTGSKCPVVGVCAAETGRR